MPYDPSGTLALAVNPFGRSAASPLVQALTPQDEAAMSPETFVNPTVRNMIESLATLPKRALEASAQDVQQMGSGQPMQSIAPAVETAMTMTGGAGIVPAEANSLRMGIKAYHGSPHDFDRFSMDKIGTGEGAQVYGHGLYFAENPETAKAYRETLTGNKSLDAHDLMTNMLQAHEGDYAAAEAELQRRVDSAMKLDPKYRADISKTNLPAAIKLLQDRAAPKGRMYQVDINADPEHFLDWDKSLNRQHPATQDALKQAMGQNWDQFKSASGGDAVKRGFIAPGEEGTAAKLSQAGIPGIKYLDQGSRAAGDGSRNYVVFNDKLIDILKKYGIGGAIPASVAGFGTMAQQGRNQGT